MFKYEKECHINTTCCPLVLSDDDGEGPIGFIGRSHAQDITNKLNSYPDLLKACKLAAKYVSKMVADEVKTVVPPIIALNIIEKAISKAEGRE